MIGEEPLLKPRALRFEGLFIGGIARGLRCVEDDG